MKQKCFNYKSKTGFIGIEALIISAIMIIAGLIVINVIFGDTFNNILSNGVKPALDSYIE